MLARLVSVVFSVWLFALPEQVTAVRDVLCLSHKPKSNRSKSGFGSPYGRYLTLALTRVPL